MVSKITIFEGHFDGAQFGGAQYGFDPDQHEEARSDVEPAGEDEEQISGEKDARSRMRSIAIIGGFAGSLFLGLLALRRVRGRDTPSVEIEEKGRPVDELVTE